MTDKSKPPEKRKKEPKKNTPISKKNPPTPKKTPLSRNKIRKSSANNSKEMGVKAAKRIWFSPRGKGRPSKTFAQRLEEAKKVLLAAKEPLKRQLTRKLTKKRGRPRKNPVKVGPKRPRGRPRKHPKIDKPKRPRGRPRKAKDELDKEK